MAKNPIKFTFLPEPDVVVDGKVQRKNVNYVSFWSQNPRPDYATVDAASGMKAFKTKAESCRRSLVNLYSQFVDTSGKVWTGKEIVQLLGMPENPAKGFAYGFSGTWPDFEASVIERMEKKGISLRTHRKKEDSFGELPGWPVPGKATGINFDALSDEFSSLGAWECLADSEDTESEDSDSDE